MSRRLALFDFCETLANFQTADAFVDFIVKGEGGKIGNGIRFFSSYLKKLKIISLFNRLYPEYNLEKRLKLLELRGLDAVKLPLYAGKFHREVIRKNLITETNEKITAFRDGNWELWIVSGGYKNYLDLFASENGFAGVVSSEMEIQDGKLTGKMKGPDCLHGNKVKLLNQRFNKEEFTEIVAFSDSITDFPLLKWAKKGIVVSKGQEQKWPAKYGFDEMVVR